MINEPNTGPGTVFKTGAKRSEFKPRFDLIPTSALKRLALRYSLGAEIYGEYNWQKGMPLSDTLNHIIDHLLVYRDRVNAIVAQHPDDWRQQLKVSAGIPDDDLAGAMWGCAALMWMEENMRLECSQQVKESVDKSKSENPIASTASSSVKS